MEALKKSAPGSLYICYQSIREPLTQTQVVPYLEGLAADGYRVFLLTFEPQPLTLEQRRTITPMLNSKGITWQDLRYHKRPTLPATIWDVVCGIIFGAYLIVRYRIALVHARAHMPGVMALALKRLFGTKLLFDIRGFMAEEYVDRGVWPAGGLLFRLTKLLERRLIAASDAIIVLTVRAREWLTESYPVELAGKPVTVIPCCVDLRLMDAKTGAGGQTGDGNIELVYAGKVGGTYLFDEMAEFARTAADIFPNLKWRIWTQSSKDVVAEIIESHHLGGRVSIGQLPPSELYQQFSHSTAGIAFFKQCPSDIGCSPTKIGEYLGAGLPVLLTAGVGDLDRILAPPGEAPIGVIVNDLSQAGYQEAAYRLKSLLSDPLIRQRCRDAAEREFDLQMVGWPRYRSVYRYLLRPAASNQI